MSRNIFITGNANPSLYKPAILDYDYWIFCDSDIEFTEADLKRILSYDKDIISLPYQLNSKKPAFNAMINGKYLPLDTKGLMKVDGCGAGFLKVKKCVFQKMPAYWFFIDQVEKDGVLSFICEDYNFGKKARRLGYDIWMDFNHPVQHNNPNFIGG